MLCLAIIVLWTALISYLLYGNVGSEKEFVREFMNFAGIWFLGMAGILYGFRKVGQMVGTIEKGEIKYRSIFEDSHDAIYMTTREGRFEEFNRATEKLFGYRGEELSRLDVRDIYVDPGDREEFQKEIEDKGFVKDYEISFRKKDGSAMECLVNSTLRKNDREEIVGYQGIIRDMTEQRRLEALLLQAQKMEAVGRLAGGIAHDINNYLGAITGFCEVVKLTCEKKCTNHEEIIRKIDDVVITAMKASALIGQILAFSRRQPAHPRVVDVNGLISGLRNMMQGLIGENISLETYLHEDIWRIKVDPSQFEQILVNLFVNARDAMPKGGEIIIETANAALDDEYGKQKGISFRGRAVMISVTDTGAGIPAHVVPHIFDPFFTTKEKGIGTGLGLSTVYGIVKQNGGYVWVYSEEGKGTTFKLYFPVTDDEYDPGRDGISSPYEKEGGTERILFVEDNEEIRKSVSSLLQAFGYSVVSAGCGEDALALGEDDDPFDLLISDVMLPKMTGKELFEGLRKLNPSLQVLFISGYTENVITKQGIMKRDVNFLQKPFSAKELNEKIRNILDG